MRSSCGTTTPTAHFVHFDHDPVMGLKRTCPPGCPIPVTKDFGQFRGKSALKNVDNHYEQEEDKDRASHTKEDLPAGKRQTKHGRRQQEEAKHQVGHSKPPIVCSFVAKAFCKVDRDTSHTWNWIPNQDSTDVEEEMAKCNL